MLTGLQVVGLDICMLYDIDLLSWVFARWQWSVALYSTKIGKRQHKGGYKTQNNTKSQNRKQKYKTKNKHENFFINVHPVVCVVNIHLLLLPSKHNRVLLHTYCSMQ
jgi:hypothetical protein